MTVVPVGRDNAALVAGYREALLATDSSSPQKAP